jgi:hypothetical protein
LWPQLPIFHCVINPGKSDHISRICENRPERRKCRSCKGLRVNMPHFRVGSNPVLSVPDSRRKAAFLLDLRRLSFSIFDRYNRCYNRSAGRGRGNRLPIGYHGRIKNAPRGGSLRGVTIT